MKIVKSKRGFVVEGTILLAVGATILLATLWKPLSSTVGGFIGSVQPQKVNKQMYKKSESKPVFYEDEKGRQVVAHWTKKESSTSMLSEESKLSLWQKIKNLGVVGILLAVAGFMFPPFGAILLFIWSRVKKGMKTAVNSANKQIEQIKDEKNSLTDEAKLIVMSIDSGLESLNEATRASAALAISSIDPKTKEIYFAVSQSLEKAKHDFLTAMSRKQNSTTKNLVKELLKND